MPQQNSSVSGKQRWDSQRPLRLAGEAVIGRLGNIAGKLPDEVIKATPEIPWREVRGMRIIAAHAYHRIDYEEVWITLRDDVPRLAAAVAHWQHAQDQ
ncbi:MAG: HepT-like ribonuclease domain-containing protein [Streptosporangiaceae bacterium]